MRPYGEKNHTNVDGDGSIRFSNKWYQSPSSGLTVWVDAEQNGVVSSEPMKVVLHIRRVLERNERQ